MRRIEKFPSPPAGRGRGLSALLTLVTVLASLAPPSARPARGEECRWHASQSAESVSDSPSRETGEGKEEAGADHAGKAPGSYPRSEVHVTLPDVVLEKADGTRVALEAALGGEKPVMLNFIFTTCGTICPLMSAVFGKVREELGPERGRIRMVSISIDPEHDTPAVLRAYSKRFDAGEDWLFLTGRMADIVAVQKAFGAYRGNKMNHQPYTFLRASPDSPWIRVAEIVRADDLAREARMMLGVR